MVERAKQDWEIRRDRVKEELLSKYPRDKKSHWRIRGEDSNPDLGGSHHMPELCVVECTYQEAVELAVSMSGFWQWGGGGDIKEVLVLKPSEMKKRQELEDKLSSLEKEARELRRLLGKE